MQEPVGTAARGGGSWGQAPESGRWTPYSWHLHLTGGLGSRGQLYGLDGTLAHCVQWSRSRWEALAQRSGELGKGLLGPQ